MRVLRTDRLAHRAGKWVRFIASNDAPVQNEHRMDPKSGSTFGSDALALRVGIGLAAFLAVMVGGARGTQDAVANGDTRTLTFTTTTPRKASPSPSGATASTTPRAPAAAQLVPARLAARRADPHGPAPVRYGVGGLPRGRIERADPRELRLPLAADQFDAPAALQRGGQEQPAHARQGHGLLPARRVRPSACAPSACGCRTAASAIIPTPTRPSSISTSAACAPGRA